ncbi:MAG TPA: invasin domain 3-containing protein [Gemmatimonadaceae bacterium]
MPPRHQTNLARKAAASLAALLVFSISCDSSTGPGSGPVASAQLSTVAAASSSIVADGKTTTQITVTLKDETGAALGKSGGAVSITTSRGTIGPVTDATNGTYTAALTSSTAAGQAVVSASIGGSILSSTATVSFVAGPAAQLTVANSASNGQSAVVGATVANPPSVKVTDANGNPVSGASVTFAIASGGGSITGAAQTTNADGVATVGSWRLGNIAGPNSLTATVVVPTAFAFETTNAATDLVVTFSATATAGAPGSVVINGGDGQTAIAGTAVATPPSIKVLDANGNPINGATVNFFIGSGGGTITGAATATDASGIATIGSWILGNTAGANTLTAGAVGVSGSVTFNATGIAGPAAAIAMANPSSTGQTAAAGSAVAIAPSVKVTDSRGNAVAGIAVSFAVASGSGSVTGGNATTDASGIATVGSRTLGTRAGPNTLTATSGSLTGSPVTFYATGTAGSAGALTIVGGNGQTAIAGADVATAPSVRVTDVNGNIVAGASVTFTVTGGGGSVTNATVASNASGIATVGSWKLGTVAGTNTLTASSGSLPPVTFTATGTPGPAASIAINAGNNQNATSGTAVAVAPSVKVTDANGNAVAGATVTFAAATGGGSITGGTATSDANGIATVGSWTLGSAAGPNTLTATLNGVTGQSVTFNATGTALSALVVNVSGRLERSETITVTVVQDGITLPSSSVTLTVTPADAGQVNSDGTIKLLKIGAVTINATSSARSGSKAITVAQPPLIVFDWFNGTTRQIWQAAIDGGDKVQLTSAGSDNQHPSRVGNRLVYASARNGTTFDIYSMNVGTSVETQLTNTSYAEQDPVLSPNGNRVVYITWQSGLPRAAYFNNDGTNGGLVDDVSNNTGAVEISPSWSPGSDKVILSSNAVGGSPDIWIQNSFGTIATRMPSPVNTTSTEVSPVWNSAGTIAFHTTRSGTNEIWITDPTGASATKLVDGAAPSWLPDGRLVFVRFTGTTGAMYWVDPANPSVVHPIEIGGGDAQRPAAILP